MNRIRLTACSAAIGWLILATIACAAPPVPKLEGPVNDYAHVMSPAQEAQLKDFLQHQEDQTSNQIVVLTVPTLNGESIEDFSLRVARQWRLGQKANKNGVLLIAAINDRKMRIEVGFGLEGALTDAISSQIIRNEIAPSFREGDYFGGLWAGVHAIDQATHGQYKGAGGPHPRQQKPTVDVGTMLFWMIVLIVILASHIRFRRYRNHWLGPVWISTPSSGFGSSSGGGGGFFDGGGGGGGYSGGGGSFGGGGASGGW